MAVQDGLVNRGEVAFVTGAGSGIGRAVVAQLLERGAAVVAVDKNPDTLEKVAADAQAGSLIAIKADVTVEEQVRAAVAEAISRFGKIDTVVASAGIEATGLVTEMAADDWDRVFAVNVRGVFLTAKYTVEHLCASDRGAFVALSSDSGLYGGKGWAAYSSSKHAVLGLTKSLALDYAHAGVRVNAVCPSWVDTPLMDRVLAPDAKEKARLGVPLRRFATPSNVAYSIMHLTDPRSAHVTGQAYVLDGGATL